MAKDRSHGIYHLILRKKFTEIPSEIDIFFPEKSFPNSADIGLDIDDEIDEEDDADGDDLLEDLEAGGDHLTPTAHLARRIGIDSHRVQLMKASLFEQESKL